MPPFPEMRDIAAPAEPPDVATLVTLSTFGALLVIGMLVGLMIFLRALRRRPKFPALPSHPATAAIRRLEELKILAASVPAGELGSRVSEALRRYLHRSRGVLAHYRTTDELLQKENGGEGPPALPFLRRFEPVLRRCDAFKYMGATTTRFERTTLIDEAVDVIEQDQQDQRKATVSEGIAKLADEAVAATFTTCEPDSSGPTGERLRSQPAFVGQDSSGPPELPEASKAPVVADDKRLTDIPEFPFDGTARSGQAVERQGRSAAVGGTAVGTAAAEKKRRSETVATSADETKRRSETVATSADEMKRRSETVATSADGTSGTTARIPLGPPPPPANAPRRDSVFTLNLRRNACGRSFSH
jgi:hypothetical protein